MGRASSTATFRIVAAKLALFRLISDGEVFMKWVVICLALCLFFANNVFALDEFDEAFSVDSTKGAKINYYCYESTADSVKERPILLVHGFNSNGDIWRQQKNNYVKKLQDSGYDVIVVDMRGNAVDTDGDSKIDAPIVGNSWGYGVRDLGDDVGMALEKGMGYLNKNLPGRNYNKADVITHSTGALAVTAYSRSIGLVPYRDNIGTIIELAPPNNGSTSLVANMKNILGVIPSVFTQSVTAYQYALEIAENKIWIPGSRMESENLRKELSPDSMFLKSIQDLGPDKRIKTFIAIGSEDWVVGDWSPVIGKRDDIGYEYFLGLDHFNFCSSETVLTAILNKLEKGDSSNFFNRFKPYKNKQLAFLSGPGIDHPDDTFDAVDFAKGVDISPIELFDLYLRIAVKKNKAYLLKYWEMVSVFEDAQSEISTGNNVDSVIDKWDETLGQKNKLLHEYYMYASREYLEAPDIAVLANGYYNEMRKLIIEKVREPVRIIDHTFEPYILDEQKVLVIPTGGLSGLSHSAIFKNKLSEYVKNGGIVICFSQQYGYDFNALPGEKLNAYGWQEDASCRAKAAYIESSHQIFSSQNELYPDVKLDGYFTNYPDGANVLLRRSKNQMPAMLMYNFGKGIVIAASIYSDWGYLNGQASSSEILLVRDILRWAIAGKDLPEYKTGEAFECPIQTNRDFSRIEMILKSPEGEILEKNISSEAVYKLGLALEKTGIYSVDYVLYDADSKVIQPQSEGIYFSFSRPLPGILQNPDFTFDITTDSENYISGSEAAFTFHIRNNTDRDETIRYKANLPHHKIEFNDVAAVPANSEISFNKKITAGLTDLLSSYFYSSENVFIGKAERGINVFEPGVEITVSADKEQYLPGETVSLNINLKNKTSVGLNCSAVLDITDSDNNQIYYNSMEIRLAELGPGSWLQSFTIPEDVSKGICGVKLRAFSNSRLIGFKGVSFEVPKPLIYVKEDIPAALVAGMENEIKFYLENSLDMVSMPGVFSLKLVSPGGTVVWQENKNFESIAPHKKEPFSFMADIPDSIIIGDYKLVYTLLYAGEEKEAVIDLPFKPYIIFDAAKTSFKANEELKGTITIVNDSLFEIEKDISTGIDGFNYSAAVSLNIKANAKTKLPISISIPQDTNVGAYLLKMGFPEIRGLEKDWQFFVSSLSLRIVYSENSFYLENIGAVDTDYTLKVVLKDRKGNVFKEFNTEGHISRDEKIDINFEIPKGLISGEYLINAECVDKTALKKVYFEKTIETQGMDADLIINIGDNFEKNRPISASVKIDNRGEKIEKSSLDVRVFPAMETGDLWGIIRDDKGNIIKGAIINGVYSNKDGKYMLDGLSIAQYAINIKSPGFDIFSKNIEILPGSNNLNIDLTPSKYGDLSGVIENSIGAAITLEPVSVAGSDASIRFAVTSGGSLFKFRYLPVGNYLLTVSPGDISKNIQINEGENVFNDTIGPAIYQAIQEIEPNNAFADANEINLDSRIHGKIYNAGDEDFFKFNITEKGILYIKMYEVPQGLRPSIKIYDPSIPGRIVSQKGGSANEQIILETEFDKPGLYYLLVRDWYGNISSLDSYSMNFNFIKNQDEYEPNETKEAARVIDFGKNYFATIAAKADSDFYKLSIPDAGKITVYLKDMPVNIRPYMKLYRDSGQNIDIKGGAAGEDVIMEFETANPSNYYIQVYDRYNSESSFLRYILLAVYAPKNTYAASGFTNFRKDEEIPIIKDELVINFDCPAIAENGKYYIEAVLKSSISQEIARLTKAFYISDSGILVEVPGNPQLYEDVSAPESVGKEAFQIIVRIENKSMASSGQCKIILLKDNVKVDEKEAVIKPASIKSILFTQNIRSGTEFKVVFEGDINKEIPKAIKFGEKIDIAFPDELTYPEGNISVPVKFINQGELDAKFDFTYKINEGPENTKNYFIPKACFYEDSLNFSLAPGAHHLIYSSDYSTGDKIINVIANAPEIKQADIKVSYLEAEGLSFSAGDKAKFRFKAVNEGNAKGPYDINFKFQDLLNETKSEFLEPGKDEDMTFEFLIPVDMEGSDYEAEYKVNAEIHKVNFNIIGMKVETEAEAENDIFKLKVKNLSSVDGVKLFAEVRCGNYENKINFILNKKEALEFNIPDLGGNEKIYYGVYFESGIALYLNSYLVNGEEKPKAPLIKIIKAWSDKDIYEDGESVSLNWKIESGEACSIKLSADLIKPDSDSLNIIEEEINLKKGVNEIAKEISLELKQSGIYRIMYKFADIGQGSVFFDVNQGEKPKENHEPVLFKIGGKEAFAGDVLEFFIEAVDIDGDLLIYSVETLPRGAGFDPLTRRFFWSPIESQIGEHFVTFIVSDGKARASERIKIIVSGRIPVIPEAKAIASPVTGVAPLEVHFSSQPVDKHKNIVKYEWDFDGKLVYDFSSPESGETIFIYTGEGNFPATLRVTDKSGTTNIYTVTINVDKNPDAPGVYLNASPLKGVAPCKIVFKGGAFCPQGISKYEWDFDGDGVFDAGSLESGEVVKTYTLPGKYNAEFRVTSVDELSGSEKVLIEIDDPEVFSVKSSISPVTGNVPVEVNFEIAADEAGSVQKYQWDFEGDGVFDYTSLNPEIVKHVYCEPGVYMPVGRVTDTNNLSGQDKKEIRFSISNPEDIKKGRIIVDSQKGKAPFTVKFSFETEDEINDAEYLWDFDGDGVIDIVTSTSMAEFTYNDAGTYMAKLGVRTADNIIMSSQETIYVTNGNVGARFIAPDNAGVESYSARNSRKNVFKNRREKIELSDKTSLVLPADILKEDDIVNIKKLESGQIQKEIDLNKNKSAGEYREYKFENRKDPFNKEMIISIPYADKDEDGIVDDKDIDELTLDAYWYDETKEEWKILSDVLVFPEENIVTAKTSHFTVFGIAGAEKKKDDSQPENTGQQDSDGGDGDGGGSGGSCFIATAAFGSPMAGEVIILKEFRDNYLVKSKIGKEFVNFYYCFSPSIADFIKDKPFLKSQIRLLIKSIVIFLKFII